MKLRFKNHMSEADNIYTFTFLPPEDTLWQAGQSIRLELQGEYGREERRFSISSAPFEKDITITTRLSDSEFKTALGALQPGDEIEGHNIEGDFVWQDDPRQVIFCASGIGITACFSILKQLDFEQKPLNLTLLYTNRTQDFLFKNKLETLQAKHPEFSIVFLPEMRLSTSVVAKHIKDRGNSLIYLAGPSNMVDDIGFGLSVAGVPKSALRQDWFTGNRAWKEQSL